MGENSSHACVEFMRHKNQALQKFKEYVAENGTHQILRSDKGTELTHKRFKQFCTNNRIKREYTVPENPEQKCVPGRYNPTDFETARSFLRESKLPKSFWLSAVNTAAYVNNFVRKDETEKSPHTKFWGRKRKTGHLKLFGCLAYVKNRNLKNQNSVKKHGMMFS